MDKDTQLLQQVESALRQGLKKDVIDMNVHAVNGKLYITGFVDCLSDKIKTTKIVQNFVPMNRLENDLTICASGEVSDKQLKAQMEDNFRHCENAHRLRNVGVKIEGGAATLIGSVRTLADEIKALEVARETTGLKDVASNLNIQTADPLIDDAVLTSRIQSAINDSPLDRHIIKPIVTSGIVTLEGTVDHNYEIEMAGELIADVNGVLKIKNRLRTVDSKDGSNNLS